MSFRTRFIWLSSLWIMLILLVFNVSIYFYVLRKTTDYEVQLLWDKAQIILRNPEIHNPENWSNPKLLQEFYEHDNLIRIIAPDGSVRAGISTHVQLSKNPAVYRTSYHTQIVNELGERMLFIQVPILDKHVQVGQLELGKALNVLNEWMEIIGTGLWIITVGVLLFAIVSGMVYTRVLAKPVRQLLKTMNEIRSKGDLIEISQTSASSRDEFSSLLDTFNGMICTLREQAERQKQFVADASHELRTPLTIIESYASLLSRWGGEDASVREEALQAIRSETERLKGIVNALLALANLEQDESTVFEPFLLYPLIRETTEQLSLAFKREIRLERGESNTAPDTCFGVRGQLKQLLIIVLDNAIKYSEGTITVYYRAEREAFEIKVQDEGKGIPAEEIPKLFNRFYRSDQTRSRVRRGSGLGLCIAKRIVERHSGSIEIHSREGAGTQVVIRLPKSPKDPRKNQEKSEIDDF